MSIPLDKLYDFLQHVSEHDVLIYRYFPHGSRKIKNCLPLQNLDHFSKLDKFGKMYVFCHDQEPLNLNFFPELDITEIPGIPFSVFRTVGANLANKYDKIILVHSELNSDQVQWFAKHGAVPVYWWSHAMIARDWFRYAQHDPNLSKPKQIAKTFLIYNRAWSGTREYRLKFAELLITHELVDHTMMGFSPFDEQTHYTQHQFTNQSLAITRDDLQRHFLNNCNPSTASADYCASDYAQTEIEIVLETLFDDPRQHLTEKTLRAIACGQPFLLLGPRGSLQYLRDYGFKTFGDYIDENYDQVSDPLERMQAVVQQMRDLANLTGNHKICLLEQMQKIAQYNQQRFFSDEFFLHVKNQFVDNLNLAAADMQQHATAAYLKQYCNYLAPQHRQLLVSDDDLTEMLKQLDC